MPCSGLSGTELCKEDKLFRSFMNRKKRLIYLYLSVKAWN